MSETSTIPCVRCGSPVPRSAQFCLTCGAPTSIRSQTAVPQAAASGVAVAATTASDAWTPAPVQPPPGVARARGASASPRGGAGRSIAAAGAPADIASARYGLRVLAYLIDSVIGLAVWVALTWLFVGARVFPVDARGTIHIAGWAGLLFVVIALAYPIVLWVTLAFRGWTVGMLALGMRVVTQSTLGRAGLAWVLVRGLVIAAGAVVFGIGALVVYLSPLWDPAALGRGWHDRAARTRVLDVRRGRNPLLAAVAPAAIPGAFAPAVPPVPAVPAVPMTEPEQGDDIDRTRLTDPGARPAAAPDALPPAPGFRFDSGVFVPVTGHGVIGRDPVSPTGDPADGLVAIDDESRSLSKTHLEFGVDGAGIWVSDRGSTNGSDLWGADGVKRRLVTGERVVVHPGDTVRIGSRRFIVTGPSNAGAPGTAPADPASPEVGG
jgi:hypothetical protein